MSDFIKSLWPRNPFTWLGLILGAMSVLALIQHGFNYGFGPTFTLLLAYYENLIHALIGWWAEPIIKAWLADLNAYFDWNLHLYPHWKHVFVLMGIYFFRVAGHQFKISRPLTGIFYALWGLLTALASSIAAGSVPISHGDGWADFLIAAVPIGGAAFYELGALAWTTIQLGTSARLLSKHLYHVTLRTSVGIAVLLFGLQLAEVRSLPSPGLAMLGALVIGRAAYMLWVGAIDAEHMREPTEAWFDAYWRTDHVGVGIAMLGVLFWTGLFIAANAGLHFYGL